MDIAANAVLGAIRAAGLDGATAAHIGAATNLDEARVSTLVAQFIADGRALLVAKPPAYIAADLADDVLARTLERLRQRQSEKPWVAGTTSLTLAPALSIAEPTLIRVLAALVEGGALVYRSGYYATLDFSPQLGAEQRAFFDSLFLAREDPPVPFDRLRALIKSSPIPELTPAFDTLVVSGALRKVGDFVYLGSNIAAIRAKLETALRCRGQLTVAEFRDLTGTSRKYALPLLEFFDATGVTLRNGDVRVLRQPDARRH